MTNLRRVLGTLGLGSAVIATTLPPLVRAAVPQQSVFRAAVDHVAVDVVATDGDNKAITDLRQSDFQITENGRPQAIADFEYVSIPVVHRTLDRVAAAAPPVDVAENSPPSATSRVWVMVVDDQHILPQFMQQVKQVMTEFVQSLPPTDEVAITFVGRSDLSQNFTTDVSRLVKAIANVNSAFGRGYGADAMTAASPGATLGIAGAAAAPMAVFQAAQAAVFSLKNTAMTLATSGHARRAIVYVSGQSVLDLSASMDSPEYSRALQYQEILKDAFEVARHADVPVYTLDPRGMAVPETATRGSCCDSPDEEREIQRRIRIQQDWLSSIAVDTNGRAFVNQSSLTGAVDEIVSDNSHYYVLGYYPDPFVRDGKFHDLKVTVSRPGVHLRARTGYIAPAAGPAAPTPEDTMATVMSTGFNITGLSVRSFVAPVVATPKGMKVAVTTEVTYPPSSPDQPATDTLHWQVIALDSDGKVKQSVGNSSSFKMSPTGAHVVVNDVVELSPQSATIRVGVTSETLGKSGSVQVPATVPDPTGNLVVSSVVLGIIDGGGKMLPEPAIFKAVVPFQPTTTRTFQPTDTMQVFAPVFWSGKDPSAHASLSIRRGAVAVMRNEKDLQGTLIKGDHRTADVRSDVPLAALAPGSYTLNLDVTLPNKQHAARAVPFEVVK